MKSSSFRAKFLRYATVLIGLMLLLGLSGCGVVSVGPGSPEQGDSPVPPQGGATPRYGAIAGYVYAPTPIGRGADGKTGSRSLLIHKYAVTFDDYSPLGGATILATSSTGASYTATSEGNGYFAIQSLEPGTYELTISHPDYMAVSIHGVEVKAGKTITVGEARVGAFHYLFIGINNYLYVPNLNGAVPDAQSMYSTFSTTNGLAGEPAALYDSRATKAAIRSAITDLASRASAQDYIMIYFSGHGGQMPGSEPDALDEFIAPYDGSPTDASSLITDDELEKWLSGSRCRNVVLIFDSCRSGGMVKNARVQQGGAPIRPFMPKLSTFARDLNIAGYVVLMASNDNQDSYENGSSGIFTSSLIQGINRSGPGGARAADTNGDRIITAREAFEYARRVTQQTAASMGVRQDPQMWPASGGDVAIYRY